MAHGELAHEGAFRLPISITRVFLREVPAAGPKRPHALLIAAGLFVLNLYICRELFGAEFLQNLSSNEGAFISLARFFRTFGFFERWYPWFNCGMPIENAYQPLLPMSAALVGKLTAWSAVHAFHFVLALFYCTGPLALFFFVLDWSRSLASAFVAALLYSLWSPAALLIPVLRNPFEGHASPLRLFNIVRYAEDPHNAALALLPWALLFLRRLRLVPAVLFCAAVVLSNAFGAVDLAIGGICIVVAQRKGGKKLAITGLIAYCLISPWLPPSLIFLMGRDQWSARGMFHSGPLITALAILVCAAVAWLTRRFNAFARFGILFALIVCALPLGYFLADVTFVPQASRYQLEMDLALCILSGSAFAVLPKRVQMLALIPLLVFAVVQTRHYRRAARFLLQPLDITQSIEYKTNMWLDANLRGERVMVSGDTEYLYNVFSSNPQMSGGHEPTVPDWEQRIGVYAQYSAQPSAQQRILWLKALGAHAITVPGEKSREAYHPVPRPHQFDGLLPVLWHEEDDTVFGVPHRGQSIAHVIPRSALVQRPPVHSLDTDPLRPYVSALDDPSQPLATMDGWTIRATLRKGQIISVQETYAPGWRASVEGRSVPLYPDALGLMAVEPGCEGDCRIELRYGVSAAAWLCRALSLLAALILCGGPLYANRRQGARAPRPPSIDRGFAKLTTDAP